MKYGVLWAESISTSVETVIEAMPFRTSSGTLMEVSEPLKASPCAGPDQSAVPFTVPSRPWPEASATVVPEAPSSLYQRARPSVTSAVSAAWAGTVGAARPRRSAAAVMPGWHVMAGALVLGLPIGVPAAALALSHEPVHLTAHSVAGLLWVAAGSQFLGLVVWYRGMAAIGIPKASQLQLAQPLLTLVWSVLLLGEHLTVAAPLTAVAVLVCIAVTQRARG